MKKVTFLLAVLLSSVSLLAQNLEKIVEKHLEATGADRLSNYKTLRVEGSMDMMGMNMKMVLLEKAPDKMKSVTSFSGTETTIVINGDKGYMINPMMGSNEPVELPVDQLDQQRNNSMLRSTLPQGLKDGKLELIGEEDVKGKAAYKIRSKMETGENTIFIDKETFYIVKVSMSVEQMGQEMNMDMMMVDYTDFDGVKMATKIETYMSGQLAGNVVYSKIEFDIPIEDSEFEVK